MSEPGYVLDASAVLALVFEEPGGSRVAELAAGAAISAVDLAEVVGKLIDRGYSDAECRETLVSQPACRNAAANTTKKTSTCIPPPWRA